MTLILMSYSESGGVTKTTNAVSLAAVAAGKGLKTVLVDLDPRGAASKWLDVSPAQPTWHSGTILGHDDAADWVHNLLVRPPSKTWPEQLWAIPSDRKLSTREEGDNSTGAELRLRRAVRAIEADLIVLDSPNRQGGPITRNALAAADKVVMAATASPDGVSGVEGGLESVRRWHDARREIGAQVTPDIAGIIVGAFRDTVPTRIDKLGLEQLEDTGLLLRPLVPWRTVVQETRATGEWFGAYTKGEPVAEAYEAIYEQVTA